MQKQNCNLPIGRKNSLSRVSKVTCGLLFCLTTCAFAVDGKVNMGSNGVDDKKVVPLVGTTKTKLDGVNQEGFKVKGQVSDNVGPLPGVNVMVKGTMTGVITDMDGNFEIVSGHRRHHASQLAGLTEIPAIVREMDDDTAILLMVDSNLQREELLPSEKAFAYKMKLDAMKRQTGRKPKENDSRIGNHFDTRKSSDVLAEQTGDSKNQIFRYIRLTYLVPDLLDRVDNKTMAFNAAVEVSYLTESEQLMLCDAIEREECTPNLSQAKRLKQFRQDGKLDENVIDAIMTEEKPIEDKLVLKGDVLAKYFPKTYTPSQKQKVIVKLLEDWHKRQLRQQER